MNRVLSSEEAKKLVEELKASGKKVVFTNGCFDIIHIGHLRYLEEAKELGDILIVGINSDASVKRLKGESRPVNCETDRAELLAGLRAVDYTTLFTEDTPVELLEYLKPSIHVKGGDYRVEDLPEEDTVIKNGGEVIILSLVDGKSTTNIISKISDKRS